MSEKVKISVKWQSTQVESYIYEIPDTTSNKYIFCYYKAQEIYYNNRDKHGSRVDYWFWDPVSDEDDSVGPLATTKFVIGMVKNGPFPVFKLPSFLKPAWPGDDF